MAESNYVRIETAISTVANTIISGVFAWVPYHDMARVPLLGAQGMIVDLVPTTFMITFMTANIETLLTRSRVRAGAIAAAGFRPGWLPNFWPLRSLLLAAAATLLLVPLMALLFYLFGISFMAFEVFFVYKLAYGAALALLITPPILRFALADAQR